jgi:tetratricopeptide (TPR) repeat protein
MRYLIVIIILIFCSSCNTGLSDEELYKKYISSFDKHDWESAIEYLDEIITRDSDNDKAYYARALANSNRKDKIDYELMIEDLNKSLILQPTNKHALFLRFQTKLITHQFDSALTDINILIQMAGEKPTLLSWKGNCAFASKNFKLAEEMYYERLQYNGSYLDLKST